MTIASSYCCGASSDSSSVCTTWLLNINWWIIGHHLRALIKPPWLILCALLVIAIWCLWIRKGSGRRFPPKTSIRVCSILIHECLIPRTTSRDSYAWISIRWQISWGGILRLANWSLSVLIHTTRRSSVYLYSFRLRRSLALARIYSGEGPPILRVASIRVVTCRRPPYSWHFARGLGHRGSELLRHGTPVSINAKLLRARQVSIPMEIVETPVSDISLMMELLGILLVKDNSISSIN